MVTSSAPELHRPGALRLVVPDLPLVPVPSSPPRGAGAPGTAPPAPPYTRGHADHARRVTSWHLTSVSGARV